MGSKGYPASLARAREEKARLSIFDVRDLLTALDITESNRSTAARLRVDRTTLQRWLVGRQAPMIDAYKADRLACSVGVHPWEVWGDLWWSAVELEQTPLELE